MTDRPITRAETIARLDLLHQRALDLAADLAALREQMGVSRSRANSSRPYDHPLADPEEVAARFGVDLDPPGTIPEWVRETTARMMGERA